MNEVYIEYICAYTASYYTNVLIMSRMMSALKILKEYYCMILRNMMIKKISLKRHLAGNIYFSYQMVVDL